MTDQVSVPLVLHVQNPKLQWMGNCDRLELDTTGGIMKKMWLGLQMWNPPQLTSAA